MMKILNNWSHASILLGLVIAWACDTASAANFITGEYCQGEQFEPTCPAQGEIIVMEKATYGRMTLGKCVTTDLGYRGCSSDQLPVLDRLCSGQHSCSVVVGDSTMTEPLSCSIPTDLARNLEAMYKCVKVVDTPQEKFVSSVKLHGSQNVMLNETACGSAGSPWIITNQEDRHINITLTDFGWKTVPGGKSGTKCSNRYGYINDSSSDTGQAAITDLCPSSQRLNDVYVSKGNSLALVLVKKGNFLIDVKLTSSNVNRSVSYAEQKRSQDGCMLIIGAQNSRIKSNSMMEGNMKTTVLILGAIIGGIALIVVVCVILLKWKNNHDHSESLDEETPIKEDYDADLLEDIKTHSKNHYHKIPRKFWQNENFMNINDMFTDVQYEKVTDNQTTNHSDLKELFSAGDNSKSYVMLGNAATGKSLICQKIAHDWAMGEDWISGKFSCVFVLKPRDVANNFSFKSHVLKKYIPLKKDDKAFNSAVDKLLQSSNTLLIVDGFDNLKLEHDRRNPNELKLIVEKKMYCNMTTMITSRPHVLLQYIPPQTCIINLGNFTDENILKNMCNYFNIKTTDDTSGKVVNWNAYKAYATKNRDYVSRTTTGTRNNRSDVESVVYQRLMGMEREGLMGLARKPLGCLVLCDALEEKGRLPEKPVVLYNSLLLYLEKVYSMKTGYSQEWEYVLGNVCDLAFNVLSKCPADDKPLRLSQEEVEKFVDASQACQSGILYRVNPAINSQSSGGPPLFSFVDDVLICVCATYHVHNERKLGNKTIRMPAVKNQRLNAIRASALKTLFGEDARQYKV